MKVSTVLIVSTLAMASVLPLVSCNSNPTAVSPTAESGVKTESETQAPQTLIITDALGREVEVPQPVERIVASGSGALRYLTYLGVQNRVVGVDDNETEARSKKHPRPYRLANPQFGQLPLIGEFRGKDDPEKLITVDPQVIFKMDASSVQEVEQLQKQTGIPVIALNYGDLVAQRSLMYETFDRIGLVMGVTDRATALKAYIETAIDDLERRTADISAGEKPTIYIGGIAKMGAQNFQSTEPNYAPFVFTNARPAAASIAAKHTIIDKEKIIEWNPDIILVDAAALLLSPSAVDELRTDPSYQQLTAVKAGEVYAVWPYNLYNANWEIVLINSYYIGQLLYPEQFQDVDLPKKADEIFSFFVDEPFYEKLQELYQIDYGKIAL